MKITLQSDRVWIRISWTAPDGHLHISYIHGFTWEHLSLLYDVTVRNGFPYELACRIVDEFYQTGCICETSFEV